MSKWKEWGDVFNHYCSKGCDHSDAAYRADQWQDRQTDNPLGPVRHKWDWRVPGSLKEIIQLLERRIEVHALWRDWLKDNSSGERAAGTVQSNQRYINQYEAAISVIKKALK